MNVEAPNFVTREPAIPARELMLANGEYANKKTFQETAYAAGLPVPRIVTESDAEGLFKEGADLKDRDIDTYYMRYHNDDLKLYGRGYFPKPIDMWAVDCLQTRTTYSTHDIFQLQWDLNQQATSEKLNHYLQLNFNPGDIGSAEYFLQQSEPGETYLSTLSIGPYIFCTACLADYTRGVNWAAFHENGSSIKRAWYYSFLEKELLQLSSEVSIALNNALTQRRTDFAFKHDFLMPGTQSTFTLIQSRVASRMFTQADLQRQEEIIVRLQESKICTVALEPHKLEELRVGKAPNEPYVLELTNDDHHPADKRGFDNLDLSHMIGLILPKYLRGGLLTHDGYRFIAYALYWGLPISLTA